MTDASAPKGIDLERFFPLRLLLRALRLSVSGRAMALSMFGLWLTAIGWVICERAFGVAGDSAFRVAESPWPWEVGATAPAIHFLSDEPWLADHTLVAAWSRLSLAFSLALDPTISCRRFFYFLACGLWAIVLWSVPGGMVARSAAIGLARDERAPWMPVAAFVYRRWTSIVAAPLCALVGVGLIALPVAVVGLLMRFSLGMVIAGALWPLVIAIGVVLAFLALGLLFGWPLMWAAVAAEGADAFEAVSRAYTYVFHRPLMYLLYVVEAMLLGALGWLLVNLFVDTLHNLCNWAASWGLGADPQSLIDLPDATSLQAAGGGMMRFWRTLLLVSVPAAFSYSYLWNASTAIYFALRREVEATELDEVFIPEESEARYGLPPLDADLPNLPDQPA